ncbi:TULIP family P47-like protein, partial [Paenibacillus larvae]
INMSTGMDSLRIYDWTQTVNDMEKQESILLRSFPSFFLQETKGQNMQAKVTGNWLKWELTDEGSGQYPIYKCYIEDGTLEVEIENKKTAYDLKNSWIKICAKIEIDENSSKEMYVFSEKEGTLYSINHSFHFDKENRVASNLLEHLLVSWFKEHRNLLNNHVNTYAIHVRTSNDLTLAGWDTGYVTSFSNVNKTIREKELYPKDFKYELEDDSIGIPLLFNMEGTFNSWEITTGADGQNVNFICKIGENSSLTNETGNKTYDFSSDAFLKVQVKLEYFNSTEKRFEDPTGLNDGNPVELKVKTDHDQNQNPPVVLVDSYFSEELTGIVLNGIVTTMFKEWLNENIDKFENIFSYFLLKETAKDENFQWLKPTTAYYGVASVEDENKNPDLDKSVFSVMSMVENHENKFPQHTVDARLLHAVNNESTFGIDMPLFVDKWIENALVAMQIGTPEQFEKTDNGLVISNKEKIKFATIENNSGNPVPGYVDAGKFRLGIINNQLVLEMEDLHWEQARGIIGHVNYKQSFDITLKSGVDELGKEYSNVLIPIENTDPTMLMTFMIEDWKKNEDLIIEIVTGVVIGILVGFIPVGKIFSKLKNVVSKAFRQAGNRMSAEIGSSVAVAMREIAQESGETGAAFFRRMSQESADEISLFTRPGMTTQQIVNEVANKSESFFSKIWKNKYKLIGGSVVGAVGGMVPTAIIKAIENAQQEHYSLLPTIHEFVANCVGAVNWPDNSEFEVETAKLQGIYLMGGKLNKEN